MISAKVIADSKNEFGNRITTMIVTFPRIILAEFNTHRMFSRNSASSRAIPFEKMVKAVEENPFIPIAWQKEHKGMQGSEYITGRNAELAEAKWRNACNMAIECAKGLNINNQEGVTKQLCNRLLEPFMWHTVIVTATEWENFFALRCPQYKGSAVQERSGKVYRSKKDWKKAHNELNVSDWTYTDWAAYNEGQAEIHMMALAEAMWDAYNESEPRLLEAGEWHIPFLDSISVRKLANFVPHEQDEFGIVPSKEITDALIKVSTSRCARISYTTVGEGGKEHSYEDDLKLHDKLLKSGHMSPFEHCAKAMSEEEFELSVNGKLEWTIGKYAKPLPIDKSYGWSGNFRGFVQYRKTIDGENIFKNK